MRALMGLVANSGEVTFRGAPLPRQSPDACVARGVVLVPEGRGIFAPMTVAENLELGAYLLNDARRARAAPRAGVRPVPALAGAARPDRRLAVRRRAADAGGRPRADGRSEDPAAGRALARARAPLIEEILSTLALLNKEGLPIVLVEQKAPLALRLTSRAYLLSVGRLIAEIDPRTIKSHDEIARYYLS